MWGERKRCLRDIKALVEVFPICTLALHNYASPLIPIMLKLVWDELMSLATERFLTNIPTYLGNDEDLALVSAEFSSDN